MQVSACVFAFLLPLCRYAVHAFCSDQGLGEYRCLVQAVTPACVTLPWARARTVARRPQEGLLSHPQGEES